MKLRAALALLPLSLFAVACGGSSDGSSTGGTGTPKGMIAGEASPRTA